MGALIGKKLGMTQVYNDKEELVPVTVVAAGPCPVVQVRSQDDNGYDALQLAFEEIPARKVNSQRPAISPRRALPPIASCANFVKSRAILKLVRSLTSASLKSVNRLK